ncbi:MAG: hypothetical protein QGG88_03485 [Gammaproteobacteria bacterium]|jgi:hypothetical protein|nr:hypothetical protein [Gammaproteobacteria bacterium]
MASLVQISANEMKFLVKRSVEGLGFTPGDQLGAGARAAACYQYGLANSTVIDAALSGLQPGVQAPTLVKKGAEWVFDAQGQSALVQAELGLGVALSHGATAVRICNTSQGVLVAPVLMAWLSKPMTQARAQQALALYFVHHSGAQRCLLMAANGRPLGLYQPHAPVVDKDELLLRIGEEDIAGQLITDGADLLGWRERSLDQGILVDAALVTRLKSMMMASFVPESDLSRASGAGPS